MREHLPAAGERRVPPAVPYHEAYLDDRGPTLLEDRRGRRLSAWPCGTFGALGWVNTAALATGAGRWLAAAAEIPLRHVSWPPGPS